jgi:hypothetical protein
MKHLSDIEAKLERCRKFYGQTVDHTPIAADHGHWLISVYLSAFDSKTRSESFSGVGQAGVCVPPAPD